MKHSIKMQVREAVAGIDRDLLASYVRNKMNEDQLSLRRAALQISCSPATLSRVLLGSSSDYEADTATLNAITTWLGRGLSDFELSKRPASSSSSLAEVEMHLHALPHINDTDVRAMMAVIKALYDGRAKPQRNKE